MSDTPSFPKPIAVTCASANTGAIVKATNETTGITNTGTVKSGKAIIELTNVTAGDIVNFRVSGAYFGGGSLTLTASKSAPQAVSLTMTETTTTNAPAINF